MCIGRDNNNSTKKCQHWSLVPYCLIISNSQITSICFALLCFWTNNCTDFCRPAMQTFIAFAIDILAFLICAYTKHSIVCILSISYYAVIKNHRLVEMYSLMFRFLSISLLCTVSCWLLAIRRFNLNRRVVKMTQSDSTTFVWYWIENFLHCCRFILSFFSLATAVWPKCELLYLQLSRNWDFQFQIL